MNNDYTEIAIVQDKSSSMGHLRAETIQGFNILLGDQKKLPGKCLLTLTQFDTNFNLVHSGVNIQAVPPLTEATYAPGGNTALLDAIGHTIISIGQRLSAMPEPERPGKVIIVIQTDGEENSSREFEHAKIMAMIEEQRKVYKWCFTFLGANQDAIQTGASIGVKSANAMTYAATSKGTTEAYQAASANICCARMSANADEADKALAFTPKQRAAQTAAGATPPSKP